MIGFGDNSCCGLSSMDMLMPLTNRQFHPNNNSSVAAQSSSGQRVSAALNNMDQDHDYGQETNGGSVRAKIMAHPLFPKLLSAYLNCQKVGAPPEVVARLEEACAKAQSSNMGRTGTGTIGEDPALDQFMEAYCEMLIKYELELSKPFKEAMMFLSRMECQLKTLAVLTDSFAQSGSSSQDELDVHQNNIDPQADDRELKVQLLRKYSGYLGSLKQEFLKKKKNGKLPKEARQQLLEWWSRHYKWPYPTEPEFIAVGHMVREERMNGLVHSYIHPTARHTPLLIVESQKLALAESTGLDLKQINNWFINQRKRHWKPSEDMQFVVMEPTNSHHYLESVMCRPFSMDGMPMLL